MYIRQLFTLEGCLQNKGIEKSLQVDGYIYIYIMTSLIFILKTKWYVSISYVINIYFLRIL